MKDEPEATTVSNTWLEEALLVTTGDRRRDYGRPLRNFADIAAVETAHFSYKLLPRKIITPTDVAIWNNLQKMARHKNTFKADNFVDVIGYTACIDDMNRHMIELGYAGVQDFESMTPGDLADLLDVIRKGSR